MAVGKAGVDGIDPCAYCRRINGGIARFHNVLPRWKLLEECDEPIRVGTMHVACQQDPNTISDDVERLTHT